MNSSYLLIGLRKEQSKIILVALLLYCFMPLLGILWLLFFILHSGIHYRRPTYILFLLLAIYMGLINSTKVPYNDQVMYHEAFLLVPHRTLWQNMTGIYGLRLGPTTKELSFGLLNVVGYYVSLGKYALFITLFTTTIYMLIFDSIYKWFHYLKLHKPLYYILSGIFTIAFFTQYFNLTIHLQRQMFATAVIMYALVRMVTTSKIPWWIVILAVTMHTSVGLFLPLFVFYQFSRKLTIKQIFLILGILGVGFGIISIFANSLLNIAGEDIYALQRLSKMTEEGTEERMPTYLLLIISMPLTLISLVNIRKHHERKHTNELFFFLFYLFNMLFSIANPNNTMQYRYFMMSYIFLPFIMPLANRKLILAERFFLIATPLFLFFRFYITFDDIVYEFAPVEEVICSNIFSLFNYNNIP